MSKLLCYRQKCSCYLPFGQTSNKTLETLELIVLRYVHRNYEKYTKDIVHCSTCTYTHTKYLQNGTWVKAWVFRVAAMRRQNIDDAFYLRAIKWDRMKKVRHTHTHTHTVREKKKESVGKNTEGERASNWEKEREKQYSLQ